MNYSCVTGSEVKDEFQNKEYYIATHYDTIEEAMKLFAEDELLAKPGMLSRLQMLASRPGHREKMLSSPLPTA